MANFKEVVVLDGSDDITVSTVSFNVNIPPAAVRGLNIGVDIPLEFRVLGNDWEAVLDDTGTAVVLSATGANPLGIYAAGDYRLNAGRDLGATEKVVVSQQS